MVIAASAAGVVAAVLGAMLLLGPGSASGQVNYPVPWSYTTNIAGFASPYTNPPGVNDWSCKPTDAHPRPVVLVHGFASVINDTWQTYGPMLADAGYCVFALNYGVPAGTPFPLDQIGGRIALPDSAAQVGAFVDKVLAATHAGKVDIVGHSEGTQVPDYWVKFLGGASKVDRYVAIAPFWHGTNLAGLGTLTSLTRKLGLGSAVDGVLNSACAACVDSFSGSAYFAKLGNPVVPGVTYTNIVTMFDDLVWPYTSGIEPGMKNITLQDQCTLDLADHFAVLSDRTVGADVLNALDPAHPVPVPCQLVLPLLGD
jgi:triacylglycerol esterase/lipase EstA (alpha/beta hydrolase family)